MLTEFDPGTIANITAALDFVCRKIPDNRDTTDLRKLIADELVRCALAGRITLVELQQAGINILQETDRPTKSRWFGRWWK
jgi:hypothetical protein